MCVLVLRCLFWFSLLLCLVSSCGLASYVLLEASLFSFCIPCVVGTVGRREGALSIVEGGLGALLQVRVCYVGFLDWSG